MLVVILVYFAFLLLRSEVYRFNPQYLVENSVLKDKDFSVEVKEIKSPKLKLSAYLFEEHTNPIVSVSFIFSKAGSAYDNPNRIGEASLLSSMLTAGAGKYDMKAYQAILEQKAISINFFAEDDDFGGNLKFLKKDIEIASNLFNLSITQPRFDNQYLEQKKNIIKSNINYQMEQVNSYLYVKSLSEIYGVHPYGRNPFGNIKHLSKITKQHLKEFLKTHIALNNLIIGISGDITEDEAQKLVDKMFLNLPQKNTSKDIKDITVNFSAKDTHISRPSLQNIGSFWASSPVRQSSEFYPMYIASQVLFGNGLGSRIYKKAREQEGLTYGVYGGMGEKDKISYIQGEFSSTPDKFYRLKNIVKEEWKNLGEGGITQQELEETKNSLIASYALRYTDIQNISDILVYMQKKNLGLDFLQKRNDYIHKINIEDVNNVAKKYFIADNIRFITIGDSYKEELISQ